MAPCLLLAIGSSQWMFPQALDSPYSLLAVIWFPVFQLAVAYVALASMRAPMGTLWAVVLSELALFGLAKYSLISLNGSVLNLAATLFLVLFPTQIILSRIAGGSELGWKGAVMLAFEVNAVTIGIPILLLAGSTGI